MKKNKRKWIHQVSETVLWSIGGFNRAIKQEFIAEAKRHNMTVCGLLEDVLIDYLKSRGTTVSSESKVMPPTPPPFTRENRP